jgi:hypothetical protein
MSRATSSRSSGDPRSTGSLSVLRRGLWAAAALAAGVLAVQLLYQAAHPAVAPAVLTPTRAASILESSVAVGDFYRGAGVPVHGRLPAAALPLRSGALWHWGPWRHRVFVVAVVTSATAARTLARLERDEPAALRIQWVAVTAAPRVTAPGAVVREGAAQFRTTAHRWGVAPGAQALTVFVVGRGLREAYIDVVTASLAQKAAAVLATEVRRTRS